MANKKRSWIILFIVGASTVRRTKITLCPAASPAACRQATRHATRGSARRVLTSNYALSISYKTTLRRRRSRSDYSLQVLFMSHIHWTYIPNTNMVVSTRSERRRRRSVHTHATMRFHSLERPENASCANDTYTHTSTHNVYQLSGCYTGFSDNSSVSYYWMMTSSR